MDTIKRKYPGKDVEMLTTCATLIANAIECKSLLQAKRSNWSDPYFDNLKTRIEQTLEQHFEMESPDRNKEFIRYVASVQTTLLVLLAEFKVQVEEDFKHNKAFVASTLTNLGFTTFYLNARKKNADALIELLFRFKHYMSPALKTKITSEGMLPSLIEDLISYCDSFKTAGITTLTFKSVKKNISEKSIAEFNAIYDEVMKISNIAFTFFKDKAFLRDRFSYNKVKSGAIPKPPKLIAKKTIVTKPQAMEKTLH